ncbi:hypothetical protein NBRC111894_1009 [Sporolactobacillus inulinus]|uniref:Uncharacterized protein n=1 Tax=Sporolactobacillus inulinus TaxID=2078 RepID=A0A4Y1Z8Y5_9BACL|nr:hypothetical protein NBRC111894_1009 [Sporolactobacillus inulinus]
MIADICAYKTNLYPVYSSRKMRSREEQPASKSPLHTPGNILLKE